MKRNALVVTTEQRPNERAIGSGEWKLGELRRRRPAKLFRRRRPRLPAHDPREMEVQANVSFRIAVRENTPKSSDADPHTELFQKLPSQRRDRILARLDLAARELPESPEVSAGKSTGDENSVATQDDARGDVDGDQVESED